MNYVGRLAVGTLMACAAAGFVLPSPAQAGEVRALPAYGLVNSVGVSTHFFWRNTAYFTEFEQVKAALVDLGIHHVRLGVGAPASASDKRHRNVRDLWTSAGIKSTLLIDLRQNGRLRPEDIPPVLEGIRSQIGRAPLDGIEGANEYNLVWRHHSEYTDWAVDLRKYQSRLHELVKSDPVLRSVPVLTPSLAPDSPDAYAALGDLSTISDLISAHIYSNRLAFSTALDRFLPRVRVQDQNAPVWITEYGWHNAFNSDKWYVSEAVKAKYLPRSMAELMLRPPVGRGIIYQLLDQSSDPQHTNAQSWFGLLDYELKKKPSYHAVRNMMHVLCDKPLAFAPGSLRYTLAGDLTDVRSVLLQKNSRAFYLLLWQAVQSYGHPVPSDLNIPSRHLRLTFDEPVWTVRTYLPTDPPHGGARGREPVAVYANPRSIDLEVPDHVMVLEVFPRGVPMTRVQRSCDFPAS